MRSIVDNVFLIYFYFIIGVYGVNELQLKNLSMEKRGGTLDISNVPKLVCT